MLATVEGGEEVFRDSGSTTSKFSSEILRARERIGDLAGDLCSGVVALVAAAAALKDCVAEKRADPGRLSARDAMDKLDRSPAVVEGRGEVGSGVMLTPCRIVGEVLRRSCRRRANGEKRPLGEKRPVGETDD